MEPLSVWPCSRQSRHWAPYAELIKTNPSTPAHTEMHLLSSRIFLDLPSSSFPWGFRPKFSFCVSFPPYLLALIKSERTEGSENEVFPAALSVVVNCDVTTCGAQMSLVSITYSSWNYIISIYEFRFLLFIWWYTYPLIHWFIFWSISPWIGHAFQILAFRYLLVTYANLLRSTFDSEMNKYTVFRNGSASKRTRRILKLRVIHELRLL